MTFGKEIGADLMIQIDLLTFIHESELSLVISRGNKRLGNTSVMEIIVVLPNLQAAILFLRDALQLFH